MRFIVLASGAPFFGLFASAQLRVLAFSNYVKSGANSQSERGGVEGQGFRKTDLSFRRNGIKNLSLSEVCVRRGWEPEEFRHLAKAVWGAGIGRSEVVVLGKVAVWQRRVSGRDLFRCPVEARGQRSEQLPELKKCTSR